MNGRAASSGTSSTALHYRAMTERIAELESAVRAQDALIAEAQRLLTAFSRKKLSRGSLSTAYSSYSTGRRCARRSDSRGKR
jgi:hypothetical protein